VPLQFAAVKVTFSPSQHKVFNAVIVGKVGNGLLVITMTFDATEVPHAFVHVAEYVPAPTSTDVAADTIPLQVSVPVHPLAVIVAFSVPHKAVFTVASNGAVGAVPVVIVTSFDFALTPHTFSHVAE
jgi:hypothetical protein